MTRSVLITGCSSGIGLDLAQTLHPRGWQVLATCRKQSDCDRLAEQGLTSFVLDHDDDASITDAIQTTLDLTGGHLDAVVLNGAFAQPGAMEDMPRDAMRAIYETNLFGPFEVIRQVIPVMRGQGHGRIVNISSVLGILPLRMRGPYCGTKFAMEGMSQVLRLELAGSGIYVSVIQPGPITSRIRQNAASHFERWIDWENSPQRKVYEKGLIPRLYAEKKRPDRFELPPSACTKQLIHALEHAHPRPKYRVTVPTTLGEIMRRVLPTSLQDRLLVKQ